MRGGHRKNAYGERSTLLPFLYEKRENKRLYRKNERPRNQSVSLKLLKKYIKNELVNFLVNLDSLL